jgi:D-alanyl-D-alanine dipeptidase
MKPYQQVPIQECHEPLVAIPLDMFASEFPHPYVKLATPYGDKSPYYLRQSVLERLIQAQHMLQQIRPGWQIQIFDAYRPIAVQQFMVNYMFNQVLVEKSLCIDCLTEAERQEILEQVYQFWAVPSLDPTTPPPHSTGAAIDITLVDQIGQVIDMGSAIDEMSPRSEPSYYAAVDKCQLEWQFQQNRQILYQTMTHAGFEQHPQEWWHFSYGDQLWAWLVHQKQAEYSPIACYGVV